MVKIPGNVKNKKKYLSNKADKLWYEACRIKWGTKCTVCGQEANQVHHWIKRSQSLATRWDLENGVPVCQSCHYVLEHSPDVKKRRAFEDKIIKARGKKWWDRLEKKRHGIFKKNLGNLKKIIKELNDKTSN